jgi:hypothetical protein
MSPTLTPCNCPNSFPVPLFEEHPEWHQGRSWTGKEADHVNPTYFTGDRRVKNVVPSTVWRLGCHAATNFRLGHGIDFNFHEVFSLPDVDMLCPNGGEIYPGNSKDKDRSVITPSSCPTVVLGL